MSRQSTITSRVGLLSILATLVAGTGLAHASGGAWSGHRDHHRHSSTCGCTAVEYAGRITIDGYSTQITSGRGMLAQVAGAFRRAGYRAWIEDGCLRVNYGHCKPDVRWHTDQYSVQIRWGWDDLRLSLRRVYTSRYQDHRARPVRAVRPVRRNLSSRTCW